MAERTKCPHTMTTLVESRGLGGWNPIEVYECDACGDRVEQSGLRPAWEDE